MALIANEVALIAITAWRRVPMLVRLAIAWIDPAGVVHGAGEHVDIDAVTLAELEEQGVVENMTEPTEKQDWHGPDGTEPPAEGDWHGPDGTTTQSEEGDWHGPDEEEGGGSN